MTQDKTDHDPSSDPPGAVSDQNGEEAESGHREDGTHPEPRTSGDAPKRHESDESSTGAAGEGSQSTGHRHNAG
ncbi:MAG TPA: hypothetical protein VHU61_08060 [Solirubrobacteraceae bacterium]|jgi:hypothetical protein|nr:hypothetical protein [Solirubrobacteraceae bacterium]